MVTTDGVAKILGFGLAKLTVGATITKSHTTVGTAMYMAPEQIRGKAVGPQADIWALGVVLFELLTGRRPFNAEYQEALLYSILNEEPPSLPNHPEVDRVIKRMLCKSPFSRSGWSGRCPGFAGDGRSSAILVRRSARCRPATRTDAPLTILTRRRHRHKCRRRGDRRASPCRASSSARFRWCRKSSP